MGCSSSDDNLQRFFKPFLLEHCSQRLLIPDVFVERVSEKIPHRVIVKNHLGKLWPVEVVQMEDGLYFQGGWSRFVSDNSLQEAEFMVFTYNGHHVFEVLIHGIDGCEKELSIEKDGEGEVGRSDDGEDMEKDTSKCVDKRNSNTKKFPRNRNLLNAIQKNYKKACTQHRFPFRRTTRRASQK